MLSRNILYKVITAVFILTVIGCSSNKKMGDMSEVSSEQDKVVVDNSVFYGRNVSPEEEKRLLEKRVVYFDFDKYEVMPQDHLFLLAHAKKLLENPNLILRIDGHTDERGSREYNIALGERRAKAVRNVLAMKGVSVDRLVTVSFGKERPVMMGQNESAWSKNRRAELIYEERG